MQILFMRMELGTVVLCHLILVRSMAEYLESTVDCYTWIRRIVGLRLLLVYAKNPIVGLSI